MIVTFVVNTVLFRELYAHSIGLTIFAYTIAFLLVFASVFAYSTRMIDADFYYVGKILIIFLLEMFLSYSLYKADLQHSAENTATKTLNNELVLLDQQILALVNKHENGINELMAERQNIVLSSCDPRRQDKEMRKLDSLYIQPITMNDNANTVSDKVELGNLKLSCSKEGVEMRVNAIRELKTQFILLSNQKQELLLKSQNLSSIGLNQEVSSFDFLKKYRLSLLISITAILLFEIFVLHKPIKKIRFECINHDVFPRERISKLLLMPNKLHDMNAFMEYKEKPWFLRLFSKYQSGSDYLKDKVFLRLHIKDDEDLIELLHTTVYKFSNKCRLATNQDILKLVKLKIIEEHDLNEYRIYKFNTKFFMNYQYINQRLS